VAVEKLIGLITPRSLVLIQPPLLKKFRGTAEKAVLFWVYAII
jgi:hypothetical protein